MHDFRAPWWLPGGHAQTIWPARLSRHRPAAHGRPPRYRRERWATPDGDFIDVDHLDEGAAPGAPLLVLFHGLEGSSQGVYAMAFAHWALRHGWHYAVPHFRGCSGELNLAPRAYHSGDFEEIGWILARLRQQHGRPLVAVGISLGGNALLRWAEEAGETAAQTAGAVAAVCSPVDLAASGHAIGRGFNRQVYTRMFLQTMRPRALAKLTQHPGLFDRQAMLAARDLYDFDNLFTAPLHGFKNTEDYWARASAKPHLHQIRIPALLLNARNDPFVPAASLPRQQDVGRHVTLWQPAHGGHVGFPQGRFPGHLHSLPEGVMAWLQQVAPATPAGADTMDEIVKAALKKWPNVPHCHGWLALDARGDWYMRDERIQQAGPFPQVKGSRITHDKLKAFIERNYGADAQGCWFFQNGPQRVYVQLEAAPWVWRVQWPADGVGGPAPSVTSHTGLPAQVRSSWLDAEGRLYLDTDLGLGLVHSQDMLDAAQAVESGQWAPQALASADAPARFGYRRDPAAAA